MTLACNIDSHGREHRYRIGRIFCACGALVAGLGSSLWAGSLPWVLGAVLLFAGLFTLLQARLGWCVLRALGFETRV